MHERSKIRPLREESKISRKTAALLLCNPSNPCGSVYSRAHLEALLGLADRHKVPIISDEIYGNITFNDAVFYSLPGLSPKVPIIVCSSLSKSYLVPGWRLGWAVVFDRHGALQDVREGMRQWSQIILGPCGVMQGALPEILAKTSKADFLAVSQLVEENARTAYEILRKSPVLNPVLPSGAMYMIVKVNTDALNGITDDVEFMVQLLMEESVWILPGKCLDYRDSFRVVLLPPTPLVAEGCHRIVDFCHRHAK